MIEDTAPTRRKFPVRWTGLLEVAGSIGALFFVLGWLGGSFVWWLEIFIHFRWQYTLGIIAAALACAVENRWKSAAGYGLLAFLCAWPVLAYWNPFFKQPVKRPDAPQLRLGLSNVYSDNPTPHKVQDWIMTSKAEVIFLMEVTPDWEDLLTTTKTIYPYQHWEGRLDNFGVALLSKIRPVEIQSLVLNDSEVPTLRARFAPEQGHPGFILYGTHPTPPGSTQNIVWRDSQIRTLAQRVQAEKAPTVVMGDFNTSPYGYIYHEFIHTTGLRDAANGHPWLNTWPTFFWLFRIPLDHVFVPNTVRVLSRHVGNYVGSDHYPVLVDLAF